MGGLLIGYECGKKNRLMLSRGFRGISSTGKETPVCGIPRPLDRAGIFLPFSSHRKPSSHWYTMPAQGRGSIALHSGFVAASRQFKSF